MRKVTVAAIQMASSPNVDGNLLEAGRLIESAASRGARLVVLPENFALMGLAETDKLAVAEHPGEGPIQTFFIPDSRTPHNFAVFSMSRTYLLPAAAFLSAGCPLNVRVNANSPSLCPTMFSVT